MALAIDAEHAVPALSAMVGCAVVDGGPTDEQRVLIGALAAGYLHVSFDVDTVECLTPHEAAAAFTDEVQRRRLRRGRAPPARAVAGGSAGEQPDHA